jgi:hypothetical protein
LPKGLVLSNGIIEGTNQANAGYYPVMIDAKDEKNNFVSQIVVFKSVNGLLENSRENIKNNQVISNDAKNKNSITSSMDDKNQSIKIRIKDD